MPGKEFGGPCTEASIVTRKSPYRIVSQCSAVLILSSGRPLPRPMLAVERDPTRSAPVIYGTTGASIAWS